MARSAQVISHWHYLADNFQTSTLDFYRSVEENLKNRAVPDIVVRRVDWNESGILSDKREYLRVARGRLIYDICAAPYGTGYFFSSWCVQDSVSLILVVVAFAGIFLAFFIFIGQFGFFAGCALYFLCLCGGLVFLTEGPSHITVAFDDLVLSLPIIGPLYSRLFKPVTYYSTDIQLMFQESIHRAVVESVDAVRSAQGLRALGPHEAQPTIRSLIG